MPSYSTSTPSATIRQETEPSAADYLYWIKASTNQTFYSDGTDWTQVIIEQDLTPLTLNPFSFEKNYNVISRTTLTNQSLNIEDLEDGQQYYLIYKHKADNSYINLQVNSNEATQYRQSGLRYSDSIFTFKGGAFIGFLNGSDGTTSILCFKSNNGSFSISCINNAGHPNLSALSFGCGTCSASSPTYILNIVNNSTGEVILLTEV